MVKKGIEGWVSRKVGYEGKQAQRERIQDAFMCNSQNIHSYNHLTGRKNYLFRCDVCVRLCYGHITKRMTRERGKKGRSREKS